METICPPAEFSSAFFIRPSFSSQISQLDVQACVLGWAGGLLIMPLFNPQNARENAAKAHASRRANSLGAEKARNAQAQPPQSETAFAESKPALDEFATKRLMRVRKQLDKLDQMMEEETDPQRLERLASAQNRVAEQERQLSGRFMPGTTRPAPEKPVLSRAAHLLSVSHD